MENDMAYGLTLGSGCSMGNRKHQYNL